MELNGATVSLLITAGLFIADLVDWLAVAAQPPASRRRPVESDLARTRPHFRRSEVVITQSANWMVAWPPWGRVMEQNKTMNSNDTGIIPDALSHRVLSGLLQTAHKDVDVISTDVDPLADELQRWVQQAASAACDAEHGQTVDQHRSQQLMASRFRTHLMWVCRRFGRLN